MTLVSYLFLFHSAIEFIFAGKNSLHLNLYNLVKQSSNNIV